MGNGTDKPLSGTEDIRTWIAHHAGRTDAFWKAQHEWNGTMESWRQRTSERINDLEKKVMWWSGAAAATGSLIGAVGSAILKVILEN